MKVLHFGIVIITILFVLYADEQGFMWVLGKKKKLSASLLHFLHQAVAISLGLLIITGGFLYYRAPVAYLSNATFEIKMIAIAALILNTYVISRFSPVASIRSFSELTQKEKLTLLVSGAVSVAGWITAAVCGLLLG